MSYGFGHGYARRTGLLNSVAGLLFPAGVNGSIYLAKPQYLWQDADGTLPVTDFGHRVRRWDGAGANLNQLLAASDSVRGTYYKIGNLEFVRFDGSSHALNALFSVGSVAERFAALRITGHTDNKYIFGSGSAGIGNAMLLIQKDTTDAEIGQFSGSFGTYFNPGLGKKFFYREGMATGAGNSYHSLNGAAEVAVTTGAVDPGGITVGARQGFTNWTDVSVFMVGIRAGSMTDAEKVLADNLARSAMSDPDFVGTETAKDISDWRFDEGAGGFANDASGENVINTNTPTSPNLVFSTTGADLAAGLIQTPSLTGVREVMVLYKGTIGQNTQWEFNGGAGDTSGVKGDTTTAAYTIRVGQNGIRVVDRDADGTDANIILTGGWRLLFIEFDQDYTTELGFGGKLNATIERITNMNVRWIKAFDAVLTDAERLTHYTAARKVAKSMGVYIDYRDCPVQAYGGILDGQSNGDGRDVISELSAEDQALTFPNVWIMQNALETSRVVPNALVLGENHNADDDTQFGPEIGIAKAYEASDPDRKLYLCKTAEGSVFQAPSSDGNVDTGRTWSTDEAKSEPFWKHGLRNAYLLQAWGLENGIGIDFRFHVMFQGESDALFTSTADVFETQYTQLGAQVRESMQFPDMKLITCRIYLATPTVPAAYSTVRAAQAAANDAFNAAVPGKAHLIETADQPRSDSIHVDGGGQLVIGERIMAVAL